MHIVGIDPGVVHTGAVRVVVDPAGNRIRTETAVFDGADPGTVKDWVLRHGEPTHIFVEKYQPRSVLRTDKYMVQAEARLKDALPKAVLLNNYGVKKLIPLALLATLGLHKFSTPTHHQDLLSAARIAVIGMVKDPVGNLILSHIVQDALDGKPWAVTEIGEHDALDD